MIPALTKLPRTSLPTLHRFPQLVFQGGLLLIIITTARAPPKQFLLPSPCFSRQMFERRARTACCAMMRAIAQPSTWHSETTFSSGSDSFTAIQALLLAMMELLKSPNHIAMMRFHESPLSLMRSCLCTALRASTRRAACAARK